MKKEKKRVQVLRYMSEGEIKTLGGNLWMRHKAKSLIFVGILSLAWMLAGAVLFSGWIAVLASCLPISTLCVFWIWRMDKEGKNLWNYVNGKEQPVDLG